MAWSAWETGSADTAAATCVHWLPASVMFVVLANLTALNVCTLQASTRIWYGCCAKYQAGRCRQHIVIIASIMRHQSCKMHSYYCATGRLVDWQQFHARVFSSGMESTLRREAWPFLLGLYPANSTAADRRKLRIQKSREYEAIKRQWRSISSAQAAR